jgi:hypothetical protein
VASILNFVHSWSKSVLAQPFSDQATQTTPTTYACIVEKYPSCMNDKLESMPLSDKEIYKFGYDAIRGRRALTTISFLSFLGLNR